MREKKEEREDEEREKILKKRKIEIYIKMKVLFLKYSFKHVTFFTNKHKKYHFCRIEICVDISKNSGLKIDNLHN